MPAAGGTLAGKLGWAVVPPVQGSKATYPVENGVVMLLSYLGSLVGQLLCPEKLTLMECGLQQKSLCLKVRSIFRSIHACLHTSSLRCL